MSHYTPTSMNYAMWRIANMFSEISESEKDKQEADYWWKQYENETKKRYDMEKLKFKPHKEFSVNYSNFSGLDEDVVYVRKDLVKEFKPEYYEPDFICGSAEVKVP